MLHDCNNATPSFEKVEKVVNPPQKPTERSNIRFSEKFGLRLDHPHIKPINRHPAMFTKKVAQGKVPSDVFIISDTRYLTIPPIKLPAPTNNRFFSIVLLILFAKVRLNHENNENRTENSSSSLRGISSRLGNAQTSLEFRSMFINLGFFFN